MTYRQTSTPVFVIGRDVNGVCKGCVFVDIRGPNKVTITDTYPIPLQTDITSAVAKYKYISPVDATSFFFQWPVAREDLKV
jgi:hypothetical protein